MCEAVTEETPEVLAARWWTRRAQAPDPHRNANFMTDDFPHLQRETNAQDYNIPRTKNRLNIRRSSTRHVKIELSKVKDRILKATREKLLATYKGTPLRLGEDVSANP